MSKDMALILFPDLFLCLWLFHTYFHPKLTSSLKNRRPGGPTLCFFRISFFRFQPWQLDHLVSPGRLPWRSSFYLLWPLVVRPCCHVQLRYLSNCRDLLFPIILIGADAMEVLPSTSWRSHPFGMQQRCEAGRRSNLDHPSTLLSDTNSGHQF